MRGFIREQTEQRLKKLAKRIRGLRKAPHDEDALHDLRVANRRFVQCLRVFKKSFDKDDARRLRSRLKKLMQRCGDVRDRDIAIKVLAEAGVRDAPLVVQLAGDRVKRQKKLAAELERWRGKRALSHWRERLEPARMAGSPENFAQVELPQMEREWLDAGEKASKTDSYSTIHRFRIMSKHYRYTLEMFRGTERRVEQLRQVQDVLGAINDCVVTKRLLRGHTKARQAIDELLKAREREFHAFWKKAGGAKRDGALHIAARRSGAA